MPLAKQYLLENIKNKWLICKWNIYKFKINVNIMWTKYFICFITICVKNIAIALRYNKLWKKICLLVHWYNICRCTCNIILDQFFLYSLHSLAKTNLLIGQWLIYIIISMIHAVRNIYDMFLNVGVIQRKVILRCLIC